MKIRFILLFAAMIVFVGAKADEKSRAVLDRIGQTVKAYNSYKVIFNVTSDGDFDDLQGEFIVSGPRFYIDIYDSKVFYDGKQKYTYSRQNNEVLIENLDPSDNNIISNPTKIFSLYDSGFAHKYVGAQIWRSHNVDVVELTPKTGMPDSGTIKLYVDRKSGLPVNVLYIMRGSQAAVNISLDRFEPNIAVSDATFRFDKSKYKGVEIIDFR